MKRSIYLVVLWFFVSGQLLAAVNIANEPLALTQGVTPNILLAIDDSGSMDAEVLFPTNDGALWWHVDTQSFVGLNGEDEAAAGVLNVNKAGDANGEWKKFIYLFPNGVGAANGLRVYGDSDHNHYAIPPLPEYAYARSPDYNKAYFNPYDQYRPWPSVGSNTFGNIDPTAAPSDPMRGSATMNLTTNIDSDSNGHKFTFFAGATLPDGTTASGKTLRAMEYFPATFYLKEALPADFGYTGATLTGYAPDGTALLGYEIKSANFSSTPLFTAMQQNFANWFSYYRKRHLATRGGVAHALFDVRKARVGEFTINDRVDVNMKHLNTADERASFYDQVFTRGGNSAGTPNKQALKHAGNQFKRNGTGAPITAACQANATILFTDGYSNPDATGFGDEDDGFGAPYEDGVEDTIADIAMHYYKTHLRSDLDTGKVPVEEPCNRNSRPPEMDCNTNLHMRTYAVTLGARGTLFDPDNPIDPYQTDIAWPETFPPRNPAAVDDLWHATINGRGELLTADKPLEIADKLNAALTTILDSVGSAAAVATNSTRLDTDTRVFQARYDSRSWSGQLLAYDIDSNGALDGLAWSSDEEGKIPAHDGRNILTWTLTSGVGGAVAFLWDNLSVDQRAAITTGVDVLEAEVVGPRRVAWLRGDRSRESTDTTLRVRDKVLGDIVNSNPAYHWKQNYGFDALDGTEGETYSDYLTAKRNEPAMIYVGANDGMLHGFRASDGIEQFAYVPGGIYENLYTLTQPGYNHRYFVDGSPRVLDAYIDGAWRTVLVGSTGAGGKSVFALDVSNPDGMSASKVMWEFSTGAASTDKLGVAIGDPVMARLATGDWVAIFGNGYNSGDNVKLMVVKLADGSLLKAINTGVSGEDNGLAHVVPVDTDDDRITDVVYAGDLAGNIWKFDLTGNSSSDWGVAYEASGSPAPLFVAKDAGGVTQPVTSRIAVGRHETDASSVMVYFGTGQYFAVGDSEVATTPQVQTFYGIQDKGAAVGSRADLVEQTITAQDSSTLTGTNNTADFKLRVVSNNAVNYSSKKGWYLDLKLDSATTGSGERVVQPALLRHDRVIFVTLQPSSDPCDFGGTSWLMELDAMTGGRLDYAAFDANNDGVINNADEMGVAGSLYAPSGKAFDQIISRPGIIDAGAKEYKYTSGSRGTLGVTAEKGAGYDAGRQSWWQLR